MANCAFHILSNSGVIAQIIQAVAGREDSTAILYLVEIGLNPLCNINCNTATYVKGHSRIVSSKLDEAKS